MCSRLVSAIKIVAIIMVKFVIFLKKVIKKHKLTKYKFMPLGFDQGTLLK